VTRGIASGLGEGRGVASGFRGSRYSQQVAGGLRGSRVASVCRVWPRWVAGALDGSRVAPGDFGGPQRSPHFYDVSYIYW
jgi:hypothetical protein